MEGILWKWTNYWSGWQPRWFVLDNGVLAYYKSQEEVNQGCKGSIKMSVCEIIVNSVDNTRLDLVIPSEQHFYLKAATPQERQQWLVALGSAKASLSARQKKEASSANPDMLKTKKSELRLYCDLLMQQVHTVKSAANEQIPNPEGKHTQINRSTSVDRPQVPNVHFKTNKSHVPNDDRFGHDYMASPRLYEDDSSMMIINTLSPYEAPNSSMDGPSSSSCLSIERRASLASSEASDEDKMWADTSDNENNNQDTKIEDDRIPEVKEEVKNVVKMNTFFSNLKISFLNLQMTESQGIPTKHFLDSCAIVITIFEMFGSPIFAPMRIDVMGNLRKITDKYNVDPTKFAILQDIVQYEIEGSTTAVRNSATDALMWLKRGLEFVYEFLLEFSKGNPDLKNCALNAYNRTLKQYHGWIVRSVISAATHTVPSRHEVLLKLALDPEDIHNPLYEEQIKDDARRFIKAMDNIIKTLNNFYLTHKLDKKYIV